MKVNRLILVAAAIALIGGLAVKPAIAYFTDTATVSKTIPISIGDVELPEMDDDVNHMIKTIAISNTGDYDIFVRAKALYPDTCIIEKQTSTNWSDLDGGYYYYSEILKPGEKTEDLNLKIDFDGSTSDFNVIIIQEATKVLYDEDGNAYADWDAAISNEDEVQPVEVIEQMR